MASHIKTLMVVNVLVFGLFVFLPYSRADVAVDPYPFVYLFRLYYDNGQLFADRDFEFKYDLVAEEFRPEAITTSRPYKGEVVSVKGAILATFNFDPKRGDPTFNAGKISVKGPYFANAAKVNFYDNRNQLLLTLDVGESSFCNDDGICNEDVGEDYENCPNDCLKPSPTLIPSPPVQQYSFWKRPLLAGLTVLAVLVVVLVVWFIIKRKRALAGRDQDLPPIQPLS